ncbi:hypothetical protein ACFWWT_38650 [Streptomyces sp. NPDC058676]|uniref:hypothetical protein n=1 Tax=unclassified Streptomyces TaxID=2593676 RepID=UPI00364B4E99
MVPVNELVAWKWTSSPGRKPSTVTEQPRLSSVVRQDSMWSGPNGVRFAGDLGVGVALGVEVSVSAEGLDSEVVTFAVGSEPDLLPDGFASDAAGGAAPRFSDSSQDEAPTRAKAAAITAALVRIRLAPMCPKLLCRF